MTKNKTLHFLDWGTIPYKQAWDKQIELFQSIVDMKLKNREISPQQSTSNYLVFCEHPHVYTLGRNGQESNLLIEQNKLRQIEAEYFKIDRGGDITYHGPGQIVGYLIFDLDNFYSNIHQFLRDIEQSIICTLQHYNISSGTVKGRTGVWIDKDKPNTRKIASIGIRASRWVTMHGFAFNINADLHYFENIVPCGIADKKTTSLAQELGRDIGMNEVKTLLKQNIARTFEVDFI